MPFCMKCGKELDENAGFCSRCGTPVGAAGATSAGLMEKIDVDYPQGESAKLEILLGAAGNIELGPGSSKFVEGTIAYDIPEWKPLVTTVGDTVRIEQRQEIQTYVHFNPFNRWSLKVGDAKPFNLDIRAGVGRASWEVGGLPITGMLLETGAGSNHVSFKKANPSMMRSLEVRAGAGELSLGGLLDANLESLRIRGGVGSIDLDFSGEKLLRSMDVDVGSGVGGLTVSVKEGVPVRARVRGLSSVVTRGNFYRSGGAFGDSEYRTKAYDVASDPRLDLKLDLGVGSVSLRTIP